MARSIRASMRSSRSCCAGAQQLSPLPNHRPSPLPNHRPSPSHPSRLSNSRRRSRRGRQSSGLPIPRRASASTKTRARAKRAASWSRQRGGTSARATIFRNSAATTSSAATRANGSRRSSRAHHLARFNDYQSVWVAKLVLQANRDREVDEQSPICSAQLRAGLSGSRSRVALVP